MMLAKLVMLKLLCASVLNVIAVEMVGNKGAMRAASFLIIILEMVLRNDLQSWLLCHSKHGQPPSRNGSRVIN